MMLTIRQQVREEATKYTVYSLSRVSGISQRHISRFISGDADMTTALLERLLGAMGLRAGLVDADHE